MNITRVDGVNLTNPNLVNGEMYQNGPSQFGNILDSAVRLLDETSRLEHELTQIQMDYASGRTDDMLEVILAEQRAHTAVTFTTNLTSRVLDAYRQIMNMQV